MAAAADIAEKCKDEGDLVPTKAGAKEPSPASTPQSAQHAHFRKIAEPCKLRASLLRPEDVRVCQGARVQLMVLRQRGDMGAGRHALRRRDSWAARRGSRASWAAEVHAYSLGPQKWALQKIC